MPFKKAIPLGTLRIGDKIGEGGFGVVHAATIEGLGLNFAVKIFNPHPFNEDRNAARVRFFQEAEMLMRLRHPYIVPIYSLGQVDGAPYILMERFEGRNLNTARPHATPDNVVPFLEYVVEALAYAHKTGIVHRDIKPSNLMTRKGTARVLDFGVATWLDPQGTRLTSTNAHCVGDAFSAPELIENPKLIDARCDVYSVGACWFWLLTGKTPKGHNWQTALRTSVQVSHAYERVMLRCLEQIDRRHQDMDSLLGQLRALRLGERPLDLEHLTDEEATVLGIIASNSTDGDGDFSLYRLEQEIGTSMSKLRMQSVHRRLRRQGLAETYEAYDYGQEFPAIRLTEAGSHWVEENLNRIEELLERRAPPEPRRDPGDDDIPF